MTAVQHPPALDADKAIDLARTSLALARRFHQGATLWVVAPQWEPHAHHIAVEFVHPVIVGKRALPAVAITGTDAVQQARLAVRTGDVVIAVAVADDDTVDDLMRRAPAWGAETVWIGYGPRPEAGSADHVLWVDSDDPMVPATGQFILLYHLLWELTHVWFEHPGLLTDPAAECTDEICVTCSDEGRLGEIVSVPTGAMLRGAVVRTAEGVQDVDVTVIGEVSVGDLVIVHAGAALIRLDDSPRKPT